MEFVIIYKIYGNEMIDDGLLNIKDIAVIGGISLLFQGKHYAIIKDVFGNERYITEEDYKKIINKDTII